MCGTGGFLLDVGAEGREFAEALLEAAFVEELGEGAGGDDERVVRVEGLVVVGVERQEELAREQAPGARGRRRRHAGLGRRRRAGRARRRGRRRRRDRAARPVLAPRPAVRKPRVAVPVLAATIRRVRARRRRVALLPRHLLHPPPHQHHKHQQCRSPSPHRHCPTIHPHARTHTPLQPTSPLPRHQQPASLPFTAQN
jgi:hypothetical protein